MYVYFYFIRTLSGLSLYEIVGSRKLSHVFEQRKYSYLCKLYRADLTAATEDCGSTYLHNDLHVVCAVLFIRSLQELSSTSYCDIVLVRKTF